MVTNRALLQEIQQSLLELHIKADLIMTSQDEVNAIVAQEETDIAAENVATQALADAIAALEAGNPALDLSGLKAAAADLGAATAAEQAAVPPPAP